LCTWEKHLKSVTMANVHKDVRIQMWCHCLAQSTEFWNYDAYMVQCASKSAQSTFFWRIQAKIGIMYTVLMTMQTKESWRVMYNSANLAKRGICDKCMGDAIFIHLCCWQ
jgi:hypothetical protein